MLSFDLSVIDIVLAMAIIIVLLLQITKTTSESAAETEPLNTKREILKKPGEKIQTSETSKTDKPFTRLIEKSTNCLHHFGYLKSLSNASEIPEECYSCPRMMQCLYSKNK